MCGSRFGDSPLGHSPIPHRLAIGIAKCGFRVRTFSTGSQTLCRQREVTKPDRDLTHTSQVSCRRLVLAILTSDSRSLGDSATVNDWKWRKRVPTVERRALSICVSPDFAKTLGADTPVSLPRVSEVDFGDSDLDKRVCEPAVTVGKAIRQFAIPDTTERAGSNCRHFEFADSRSRQTSCELPVNVPDQFCHFARRRESL